MKTNKKFLAIALVAIMLIAALSSLNFVNAAEPATSLQTEIDTAQSGATITLEKDYEGNITIPEGKSITLDLNGHSISASSGHTITIKGTLVISGEGYVNNTSTNGANLNNEYGTLTVNGGNYTKPEDTDYYVLLNHGTTEIKGGTFRTEKGKASLIDNGWYTPSQNAKGTMSSLTINGGRFEMIDNDKYIKNDDYGTMVVNSGEFEMNIPASAVIASVGNHTTRESVEINGGDFTYTHTNYVIWDYILQSASRQSVTIKGGNYNVSSKTKLTNVPIDSEYHVYSNEEGKYKIAKTGEIEFAAGDITVLVGKNANFQINYTTGLEKYVKVESLTPDIATVTRNEEGVWQVKGVSAGKATIEASLSDTIKTTKEVTVLEVKVEADKEELETNKEQAKLEATASKVVEQVLSGTVATTVKDVDVAAIRSAVLAGTKIVVGPAISVVSKSDTAIAEDVKKVEATIKNNEKVKDSKVAGYFNIDVLMKAANTTLAKLTELEDKITIKLDVPEIEEPIPEGYKREFYVVRVHEGVAEVVEGTEYSETDKAITVATDKFSTYAIVYKDVKIAQQDPSTTPTTPDGTTAPTDPDDASTAAPAGDKNDSPKTGDDIVIFATIFIVAAVVGSMTVIRMKKGGRASKH